VLLEVQAVAAAELQLGGFRSEAGKQATIMMRPKEGCNGAVIGFQ
jgi:hypothetical protein